MKYSKDQLRQMCLILVKAANDFDPRYHVFIHLVRSRANVSRGTLIEFIKRHAQGRA